MSADSLSARLVEIESMLDRARRRFEDGQRLVEEAHSALAEAQQALMGSPVSLSAEDSEEASSRLLDSLQAQGN
jgi:exonuclease VII small subunit